MTYDEIKLEIGSGMATITLNRPEKLNAFTTKMGNEIIAAFDQTDADDNVRVVVITGAGRAFCAGADLAQGGATFDYEKLHPDRPSPVRQDGTIDYDSDLVRDFGGVVALRIFDSLKPTIAAVNGPAVGIGATLQLAMDARMASTQARFGFVFSRRAIATDAAASWFLPRIVGLPRALEWCISGRVFPAWEALSGGLVRSLHDPTALMEAARTLAHEFMDETSPVSVALIRQLLWRTSSLEHPMLAHRVDSKLVFERGRSADAHEGIRAFLEKRAAIFPDRVSSDMPASFPWWIEPGYLA